MYFVSLGNWPRYKRSCVLLVEVGVDSREKSGYGLCCARFSFRGRGGSPMFRAMLLMVSHGFSGNSVATEMQPTPPVDDDAFKFPPRLCYFASFARAKQVQISESRVQSPTLPAACDCDRSKCDCSGGEEGKEQSFQTRDAYCIVHIVDIWRGIESIAAPPSFSGNLVWA